MIGKNFIHKSLMREKEAIFEKEDVIVFDDKWTMADIAVASGLSPSKTQARKNGFDTLIPAGYTERLKNKKKPIFIFNKI